MHHIAKQTPPEWQESPLFTMEDFPENIAVFGNRDYNEHIPDFIQNVKTVLESGELFAELELFTPSTSPRLASDVPAYGSIAETITAYLPPVERGPYTPDDCSAIIDIANRPEPWDYFSICAALKIVTGKPWDFACIRGNCQSEWNDVIWSENDWSAAALHDFQVEYFNTGTEWQIDGYAEDGTQEDFGIVYTHGWSNGDAIKEIAAVLAADPDEITLQHFTGWKQIPEWEEV